MENIETFLKGGDLRSIGQSNKVVSLIQNQQQFDALFNLLFTDDRKVVMRAADAIEKITGKENGFLTPHKNKILQLCSSSENKELKWHLALLVTRLTLSNKEFETVWQILSTWAMDKKESRIVRVNALQGLYHLSVQSAQSKKVFRNIIAAIENEHIPSINARIRKLKGEV